MYHYWDTAIRPILSAAKVKTLVEIGAAYGEHTVFLAQWAEANRAVLHVIDPQPAFEVEPLERHLGKRFVLYQALSLEALPKIRKPDAVLIDGDHNWYTVYHELRLIERLTRRWPVTFFHDIDWPYGRRDLYYDPDNVPAEYRHPHQKSGIVRGRSSLSPKGTNPTFINAAHEGGPRNGVLTAIEDFMDDSKHDLELFTVRGPGGLGVLLGRERLKKGKAIVPVVKRIHDQAFGLALSPQYASRFFGY